MRQKKDTVQSRRVKRNNHDKEVECNRREAVGHSKRTDETHRAKCIIVRERREEKGRRNWGKEERRKTQREND